MSSQSPSAPSESYILGHTSKEYQRLRQQALQWEFVTRRLLQQLDLSANLKGLDVGCGSGDVMRLMAELSGPSASMTGIDINGRSGQEALQVLQETTPGQFRFIEADLNDLDAVPGAPFDLTFARLILLHVQDPVRLLQRMATWTKPGGIILVQEYDSCAMGIYPEPEVWQEFDQVCSEVFKRAGKDPYVGRKLPAYFQKAGIGAPEGTDITGRLTSLAEEGGMLQAIYRSILPLALQWQITTEERSQHFFQDMEQAMQGDSYSLSPLLISAWKQV